VTDCGVISAESFYHPLRRVWHGQDGAETTVMHGEWTTSRRSECSSFQHRRQLVHVIRSVSSPLIAIAKNVTPPWKHSPQINPSTEKPPLEVNPRGSVRVRQGFIQDFISRGVSKNQGSHTDIPVTYLLI